jgi:DNA-binding Xre family transcriptional regulator
MTSRENDDAPYPQYRPTLGHESTTLGRGEDIGSNPMGNARRPKCIAARTRRVLAENVKARMKERFRDEPDLVRALAESAGVSRSTVQRTMDAEVIGISIDTLTQMANALHCEPYELLMPDRFQARHPQKDGSQKDHSGPPPTRRQD